MYVFRWTNAEQSFQVRFTYIWRRSPNKYRVFFSLDDNENNATEPTDLYYQASGATFAYSFVNVAEMGIDILGMSQVRQYSEEKR